MRVPAVVRLTPPSAECRRAAELIGEPRECFFCGAPLDWRTACRDHLTPTNRGGTGDAGNLVWACQACNVAKDRMTLPELLDWAETLLSRHRTEALK